MAGGRPTSYTEGLGDLICEGVSRKTPLARLCDENEELPTPRTVYKWLRTHKEFVHNYTRAKEDQADYLAEECLDIADRVGLDAADKRIMVDTRKWLASKFQPKKYSDKQYIETKDTTQDVTDEELNAKILELMEKAK
ncbi:MAG: hypothetical protein HRU18_14125 [Pseudoalteromonas sp.]|uniref:terminase small subunit-like protein n=1 Tax=Pseudoalteromonas sp. TaxID=53249 RepID=UPI001D4B8F66|nr:hypothetical protein [Pseudoalteromonas sp.]NRA79341.1 hypothetical protein [Pseudoalteromonas sp.]